MKVSHFSAMLWGLICWRIQTLGTGNDGCALYRRVVVRKSFWHDRLMRGRQMQLAHSVVAESGFFSKLMTLLEPINSGSKGVWFSKKMPEMNHMARWPFSLILGATAGI